MSHDTIQKSGFVIDSQNGSANARNNKNNNKNDDDNDYDNGDSNIGLILGLTNNAAHDSHDVADAESESMSGSTISSLTCSISNGQTRAVTSDYILSSLLRNADINSRQSPRNRTAPCHLISKTGPGYVGPVDLDDLVDDMFFKHPSVSRPVDLDDVDDGIFFDNQNQNGHVLRTEGMRKHSRDSNAEKKVGLNPDSDADEEYFGPVDLDELSEVNCHTDIQGPIILQDDDDDDDDDSDLGRDRACEDAGDEIAPLHAESGKGSELANECGVARFKSNTSQENHKRERKDPSVDDTSGVGHAAPKHLLSMVAKTQPPGITAGVKMNRWSWITQQNNASTSRARLASNEPVNRSLELRGPSNSSIPRTIHIISTTVAGEASASCSSSSSSFKRVILPPSRSSRKLTSGPVDLDETFELEAEFESILDSFEVDHWTARDDDDAGRHLPALMTYDDDHDDDVVVVDDDVQLIVYDG